MQGSYGLLVQERRRGEDANAMEGIEGQQIEIAGEDRVSATMDGGFKELVVARVATEADGVGNENHFGSQDECLG